MRLTGRPRGQQLSDDQRRRPYYAKRGKGAGDPACVYSHRLRAQQALGKPLPPNAIVHHVGDPPHEDAPLVICQDQAYHMLLHARLRVVRAGGNPNTEKVCYICKQPKRLDAFDRDRHGWRGRTTTCKACRRLRDHRRRGSTVEARDGIPPGVTDDQVAAWGARWTT